MEQSELKLLEELSPHHPELKTLWEEHVLYKKQLEKFENKKFLTPQEEQQTRQLKKVKLEAKTKLVALLQQLSKKES